GALHNSEERYDPPNCHHDTRTAVLQKIKLWVEEIKRASDFLWLHGSAGVGKSAIAQTIAEWFKTYNQLAATFFFSCSAAGRGDSKHLIVTLVYQLCQSMPEIRSYVEDIIDRDPLVLSLTLQDQVMALIIEPVRQALQTSSRVKLASHPNFIIIDGLDECGDDQAQCDVLRILSSVVKRLPIQMSFLIASRPEPHIRKAFETTPLESMTVQLALDESYLPSKDIEIFLLAKFENIKQNHPIGDVLGRTWPAQSDINSLVRKASGQFIYASTVIKY
ncbi:NACHT domain-containing protein, partial [Crassisporium funariophilum]